MKRNQHCVPRLPLVLGGTAYRVDVPVSWKLSKKGDNGQVAGKK